MTVREGYSEWPDMESYSDIPLFNTKAVVQQTGIPAPTLRAWERRYALLSPERANNDYRLYSERDIVMIRWLKERVDEGMAISQAIALFRHIGKERSRSQETKKSLAGNALPFHVTLPDVALVERVSLDEESRDSANSVDESSSEDWPQISVAHILNSNRLLYNMSSARRKLIESFKVLDETSASLLMASMLAIYPVEQVCSELIAPTMWQIGQLWEEGQITVPIEHFASAFFRGLLSNLLHIAPASPTAPLVIVCCAPGEPHELAPLMLSLLLSRAGLRVAYLGQSIEIAGLLQTIKQLAPALICVSLTIPAYLAGLIDLGRQVEEMPAPRPLFAFGGQVFVHYTHLIPQVPGIYMSGDLKASVAQLQRIVAERP